MSQRDDCRTLTAALERAGASPLQVRMAAILLAVNGLDNALSFVSGLTRSQIVEDDEEYTLEELVPLPAKCSKCKRVFVGKDAIRAPSLANCCCFWCHGRLAPHPAFPDVVDAATRRRQNRPKKSVQGTLFDVT